MKIFSPTSAGDWKTFIKSAQPLQAPHFIIDVTRPQDGMQDRKKSSMNSKNPRQATWRTSDRSPWWLRSTSYSQPDGNYKANCYMHLWNNPHNSASNIQFDDNKCAYHSRSYFCQPLKGKRVIKKIKKVIKKKVKKATKGALGAPYKHVSYCGNGWFSKIKSPAVDSGKICRDNGYTGIGKFGGNWGKLCDTSKRVSDNRAGNCQWGSKRCHMTVSWECTGKKGR
jgi:hypothetical protein